MKIQELRQLTPKKLAEELAKAQRDLAVSCFHVQTNQSQDVAKIGKLKKVVAQAKTLLNENKRKESLNSSETK